MNTALNIRDVGPEIKTALAERASREGKPMSEVAKEILSDALSVQPETPAEKWKRENADAIASYNARTDEVLERVYAVSAVPIPRFNGQQ